MGRGTGTAGVQGKSSLHPPQLHEESAGGFHLQPPHRGVGSVGPSCLPILPAGGMPQT